MLDFASNSFIFGRSILCKINELEHDHVLKTTKIIITEDFSLHSAHNAFSKVVRSKKAGVAGRKQK